MIQLLSDIFSAFSTYLYNGIISVFIIINFMGLFNIVQHTLSKFNINYNSKKDYLSVYQDKFRVRNINDIANIVSYPFGKIISWLINEIMCLLFGKGFWSDKCKKDNSPPVILYQDKYRKAFDSLFSQNYDEKTPLPIGIENKCTYVFEDTPGGTIAMFFNPDEKYIGYYSNHTIPTKYLRSAAMKFILNTNSPQICDIMKHRDDELNNNENDSNEKIEKKKIGPGLAARRGVTTKLKVNIPSIDDPKKNTSTHDSDKTSSTDNSEQKYLHENDIKFNKRGTLLDIQLLQSATYRKSLATQCTESTQQKQSTTPEISEKIIQPDINVTIIDKTTLSFAEYKKLTSQQKIKQST